MSIEHADLTSIHRFAYVSNSDPGAVGANKGWVDTSGASYVFKVRNAGNTGWNNVGAVYTASNVGTGIGIFKDISGSDLRFKKIEGGASSTIIVAAHPTDTDSIAIDVVPANLTLSTLSGNLAVSRVTASTGPVLFGRYTASSGTGQEITIGTGLTLNTTSGVLGATVFSKFSTTDINMVNVPAFTTIVETTTLGGAGTYAVELYIPFDNEAQPTQFYIFTTASLDYYVADWLAVSTADGTAGVPTFASMKSFDPLDIFDSGISSSSGYVTMQATVVVGVNGKLKVVGYYDSFVTLTNKTYRGARITVSQLA